MNLNVTDIGRQQVGSEDLRAAKALPTRLSTGRLSSLIACILICAILFLTACNDAVTVADTNELIPGKNWSYTEKVQVPVEIKDAGIPYNIYLNLRHTGDYRYSNIFVLVHFIDTRGKKVSERKEFTLALPDGEWLGSGSGNMYSYQILFKENFTFPVAGKYTFELEQNMRDNPLDHVTDAGIRVEKAVK